MTMDKESVFAGSFYPADTTELSNLIDSFYNGGSSVECKSKAIIVPHAGYVYSGHAALAAYKYLEPNENIFIIAPSHHQEFNNITLPQYSFFNTPLGSVEVNNKLIKEISERFPSTISNVPFENEHSIEVQLPLMQHVFYPRVHSAVDFVKHLKHLNKKIKIIPILTGKCDYRLIADIIAEYWENSSFIISSDLSHFYTHQQCRQIDAYTANIIESGKIDCFEAEQACGLIGIKGLVEFANNNNYSMIRVEMYNSGDISSDKDRVVGYGSWFLYTESKNTFIEAFYKDYIINIVKNSIKSKLEDKEHIPQNIPPVLLEYGASFITLEIDGHLRGCIGSIYPTKPLILDLIDNAQNAAFHDPRFLPLSKEDAEKIKVSISLLSPIERIKFKDERDLLSKIYPYGIIISEYDRRAVYLPVVWEQLPDRDIFLNSLKEKAGLPASYFSKTLEAYKFSTVYLKEE